MFSQKKLELKVSVIFLSKIFTICSYKIDRTSNHLNIYLEKEQLKLKIWHNNDQFNQSNKKSSTQAYVLSENEFCGL